MTHKNWPNDEARLQTMTWWPCLYLWWIKKRYIWKIDIIWCTNTTNQIAKFYKGQSLGPSSLNKNGWRNGYKRTWNDMIWHDKIKWDKTWIIYNVGP